MKLKLILNPVSGNGKAKKCWPKIKEFLEINKIPYHLDITDGPGHAILLAKKAVEAGFDTIVGMGGDGLSNEIVNGIAESNATLGIIPCGEANDFPKMLGLSGKNWEEALRLIAEGSTKRIDVGLVNGRYFLNVVGVGIDGEINESKARVKKYVRGFLGYLIQTFLILITYRPKKIKLKLNGIHMEAKILLASIGNGRCVGDGFLITPDAEIDDGFFDVCLTKYINRFKTMLDVLKVTKGNHVKLPYVSMLKARELEISSETQLIAHIDGEIAKDYRFQLKILPKKLRVFAKKNA